MGKQWLWIGSAEFSRPDLRLVGLYVGGALAVSNVDIIEHILC